MVAPPGLANVPLTVGSICFGITVIGAIAAWAAKETHRIPLHQLGFAGRHAGLPGGVRKRPGRGPLNARLKQAKTVRQKTHWPAGFLRASAFCRPVRRLAY